MENNSQEAVSAATLPMDEYVKSRQTAEPNAAEEKTVIEAAVAVEEEETAPAPENEEEESGKGRSSYAKLRERIREYKGKEESWQSERTELLNRLSGKTEKVEAKPEATTNDPEPTPDKFPTYEAFVKAQARWEARQEINEQQAKTRDSQQKQSELEQVQKTISEHNKRIAEAKAKIPDFEEVADEFLKSGKDIKSDDLGLAIAELDNSADVVYHLAKNLDLVDKLNEMPIRKAISEVGRISASLVKPEAEAITPKPKTSAAPAPIKPVNGNAGKSTVPLAQLPMEDYAKARRAGRAS